MTARKLTEAAYSLIGLINENGVPSGDTDDLDARALAIINLLLAENSELDCRIRRIEHSVCTVSSLDSEIDMSDIIKSSVLPYGLASLFMLGEDDALSEAFGRKYTEARRNALRFGKAKTEPITEVYQ